MRDVTGAGGGARPDGGAGSARSVYRPALSGLVAVAAIWLTWWLTATLVDRAGHVDAAYLVVFLGGPVALLATLVVLVVAVARVADSLLRRRRSR